VRSSLYSARLSVKVPAVQLKENETETHEIYDLCENFSRIFLNYQSQVVDLPANDNITTKPLEPLDINV
jgi:hypothetical protein